MSKIPSEWTREYFVHNSQECEAYVENPEFLSSIPWLDSAALHFFKDGQLVRFRGMIQDIDNPEYFPKQYKVRNKTSNECVMKSGLYTDRWNLEPDQEVVFDSTENTNSERQKFFVISIPGLNSWAKNHIHDEKLKPEKCQASKSENSGKRVFEDMEVDLESISKKSKVSDEKKEKEELILSKESLLNFPIHIEGGKACVVKIYGDSKNYKLNGILDVVGFLSFDQLSEMTSDSEDFSNELEFQTHNPPAWMIPRLHVIKTVDNLKAKICLDPKIQSKIECIRNDLHKVFTHLLFGDALAAEFLICHLISSVFKRAECLPLGSFPLNLMNVPIEKSDEFAKELYNIFLLLVQKSHYLECSVKNLNELSFVPKKDYECNRLTSGILQLSDNTHLVIDETKMKPGILSAIGQKNYRAVCDLVSAQSLQYDFQFYEVPYETNIPVLILSEGAAFIKDAIPVQIQKDEENYRIYSKAVEAAKIYLKDEEKLNDMRSYLMHQKQAEFEIHDETTKMIQEDFLRLRKSDENMSANDFHRLMVLSRLLSQSYGLKTLDPQMWRKALEMDLERKNRVNPKK